MAESGVRVSIFNNTLTDRDMTTERMKRAVSFCGYWSDEKFKGDINDFNSVSAYLSRNLAYAKECAIESAIGIEDNLWK